jgi:hypothetical protein
MLKIMLLAATMLTAGTAFADEVIIHRDSVDAPTPSSTTTIEKHESSDGCASKTVHKENDAGDSKTVKTTNCD